MKVLLQLSPPPGHGKVYPMCLGLSTNTNCLSFIFDSQNDEKQGRHSECISLHGKVRTGSMTSKHAKQGNSKVFDETWDKGTASSLASPNGL